MIERHRAFWGACLASRSAGGSPADSGAARRMTSYLRASRPRSEYLAVSTCLENVPCDCYSDPRMKSFSRATNSYVMAAALSAVIIGSLCFSVGEGLRLTPFPIAAPSRTQDSSTVVSVKENPVSLSKYGPLDIPAQTQKRGKRSTIELASASPAGREPVIQFVVGTFEYDADELSFLPHIARPSGRAPPLNS